MKIVYTHTGSASFVSSDLAIFNEAGSAKDFSFNINRKWTTPFVFFRQLFFLLSTLTSTDIYICQFAGYHSFLPCLLAKITGKKSLIISGGTDCVSYPGIGYGNFSKGLLGLFTKWSFRLATHLSPKHETLLHHTYTYDKTEPATQGILAFVPRLNKPVTVIPNGYDNEKFKPAGNRESNTFITLCGGWQFPFQEKLKGIDLILETAVHFPQCQFTIAGVPAWKKLNLKSTNVKIIPPLKNTELADLFSRYQFYMQLSMAEGFPNALCEAMLCGCVPIVSDVFSMPEIVGNAGFILNEKDADKLNLLLHSVINSNDLPERSASSRKIICYNYSIELRRQKLQKLVTMLVT